MLAPGDESPKFVVYLDQVDYRERESTKQSISPAEMTAPIEHIRAEFSKAGHTVEFNSR